MSAQVYNGQPVEYTGTPVASLNGSEVTVTGFTKTWNTSDGKAPVNVGSYTLTISVVENDPKYTGSVIIPVVISKAPVTITAPSRKINVGETAPTFTATDCIITGLVGEDKLKIQPTVSYESTPDTYKEGLVTIKASGAAVPVGGNYEENITYVDGTLTITSVAVTGVSLNKNSLTLTVGESDTLTADVTPTNATNKSVSWDSSDPSVAEVDANGKVTAVKAGSATITATTQNEKSASCTVTVNARQYTISYNFNGGSGTMDNGTATEGKAFVLPECGFTPPNGKVFDAWAIGSVSGEKVKAGASHTFTSDTTFYAMWKDAPLVTYTITYNSNGGSGTMNNGTAPDKNAFVLPECGFTPPNGKVFDTWAIGSVSGEKANAGASHTFTSDTTLYAIWKDAPQITYTITYNANGGSGTMDSGTAPDKDAFVLPECGFTPPNGKVFDAWAIGSVSGEKVKAGESRTFTGNTTLYAIWKDAPLVTYTIIYNSNGGSGTMNNGTAPDKDAFVLPECGFTAPNDKEFDCWAVGNVSGTHIKPGGSYTFNENTTVYAVWKDLPYSITGTVVQNGNAVSGVTVQLKQGLNVIAEQATGADGSFTFTGITSGTYNLVAKTADGIINTVKQEIVNSSKKLTIPLPEGKTNTVVDIKDNATPPVVVGAMETIFQDETAYKDEDKKVVRAC